MTSQRPKDLVFTLFGEYLLDRVEHVWVGSLIALLEPLGLREGAVRTALSRMAAKGWLEGHKEGRRAFYRLTPRGRRLLEEGQSRIYRGRVERPWDGAWLLLAYSIPEESRHLRDRLRDRLAWLGFGSLGNGLWISPHDVSAQVLEVAGQLGIGAHVECFRAHRATARPVEELVATCWDLPGVNARYAGFLRAWTPRLAEAERAAAGGGLDPRGCYELRFSLIHEWRAFPLHDPDLPDSLLPSGWLGADAAALFGRLHDLLAGPADDYVDGVLGAPSAAGPERGPG